MKDPSEKHVMQLVVDPPGARRGEEYKGVVTVKDPEENSFKDVVFVRARAADKNEVNYVHVEKKSDSELLVKCIVAKDAHSRQRLNFRIVFLDHEATGRVYLRVVDNTWDPAWRPQAVAPPQTTVSGGAKITLDATNSRHPAGIEAMDFKWWIDDGETVIKAGPLTSTTLPKGEHKVVLIAEDRFGNESRDTTTIRVE